MIIHTEILRPNRHSLFFTPPHFLMENEIIAYPL